MDRLRCGLCQIEIDDYDEHCKSKGHKSKLPSRPDNKKLLEAKRLQEQQIEITGKPGLIVLSYHGVHGASYYRVKCTKCGEVFDAYAWSIAGSGKKCPSCEIRYTWWDLIASSKK